MSNKQITATIVNRHEVTDADEMLTQWSTGIDILIKGANLEAPLEVSFFNHNSDFALAMEATVSNEGIKAHIPNVLLQEDKQIYAVVNEVPAGGGVCKDACTVRITVKHAKKPTNYINTETDRYITDAAFNLLCKRIDAIIGDVGQSNDEIVDIRVDSVGNVWDSAGDCTRDIDRRVRKLNDGGLELKDEVLERDIYKWLGEHPEATTTVQDGVITEAKLNDALNKKIVKGYDTVQDMINDTANLRAGMIVRTLGFYSYGDGGAALYRVSATTASANGMDVISLDATLKAVFVVGSYVTPEMFGAYGNGVQDDTASLKAMFACLPDKVMMRKEYKVSDTITVSDSCEIIGGSLLVGDDWGYDEAEPILCLNNANGLFYVTNLSIRYRGSKNYLDARGIQTLHAISTEITNYKAYNLSYAYMDSAFLEITGTNPYLKKVLTINGEYCSNCRCAAHLSDCEAAHISNVFVDYVPDSNLLGAVFYCRPNINAFFDNVYVNRCTGSVFHCNREIFEVATPPYSTSDMRLTSIFATNVKAYDCRRLIDVNSYVNAVISNVDFHGNNDKDGGFVEMIKGSGSVKISNANVENVKNLILFDDAVNADIPSEFAKRSVHISDSIVQSELIVKADANYTGGDVTVSNSNLKLTAANGPVASFKASFTGCDINIIGNVIEVVNAVNAVILQAYTQSANFRVMNNFRKQTTYNAFLLLSSTASNNTAKVAFNSGGSNKMLTDNGTNNTASAEYNTN